MMFVELTSIHYLSKRDKSKKYVHILYLFHLNLNKAIITHNKAYDDYH